MSGHTKWADIKRSEEAISLPPEEGRDEGLGLGELRAQLGVTQVGLAERMQVDQPRVSRLERQEDLYLSTLRDYVRGLGGELELLARFPDDRVIWIEPPSVPSLDGVSRRVLAEPFNAPAADERIEDPPGVPRVLRPSLEA